MLVIFLLICFHVVNPLRLVGCLHNVSAVPFHIHFSELCVLFRQYNYVNADKHI